ncbi:Bromodomain adjacent to zinc finger domain protein 2B [Manis javanica]|nr:Bromodomain adjacent to zinc finger domain protein 2B [Manis javanica]
MLLDFEGLEEIAKEREKLKSAESIQIKEEIFDTSEDTLNCSNTDHCEQKEDPNEKDNTNLILQKPGSFSKLSKLLEVSKVPSESDVMTPKSNSGADGCALPHQNSGRHSPGSMQPAVTQNSMEKTDSNLFNPGSGDPGKAYSPLHRDQLLKHSLKRLAFCQEHLVRTLPLPMLMRPLLLNQLFSPSRPLSHLRLPQALLGSSAQNPVGLNPFALSPLQGWIYPEPASEREDLVYFEHKSFSKLCKEHDGEFTGEEESSVHALERKSDSPLDIAVTRLAELERNIERRLEFTMSFKTVSSSSGSIFYQASCQTLKIKKLHVKGKKTNESKKGKKITGDTEDEDSPCTSSSLKRGSKDLRERKMEENTSGTGGKQESFTSVKKLKQDDSKDPTLCSTILTEMETRLSKDMRKRKMEENTSCDLPKQESFSSKKLKHDDSNDLTLCRNPNPEAFAVDVRLVFDNCEAFNEDDSDTGRAGHSMRKYFEKKWTDTL